jgi:hypothetical protein
MHLSLFLLAYEIIFLIHEFLKNIEYTLMKEVGNSDSG